MSHKEERDLTTLISQLVNLVIYSSDSNFTASFCMHVLLVARGLHFLSDCSSYLHSHAAAASALRTWLGCHPTRVDLGTINSINLALPNWID